MGVVIYAGGYVFNFAEGEVSSVEVSLSQGAGNQAIPFTGPASSQNTTEEGATKLITIKGQLMDTTTSAISGYGIDTANEKKKWLESLFNGDPASLNCKIEAWGDNMSVVQASGATAPYLGSFTYNYAYPIDARFTKNEALAVWEFSITFQIGTSLT